MLSNPSLKWGLTYGMSLIVLRTVLQFVAPRMIFQSVLISIISFGLPVLCMIMAGKEVRKLQDGVLAFRQSMHHVFLVYAIGSLLLVLHLYFLINFIDPSLLNLQQEVVMETTQSMLEYFDLPEDTSDDISDQMAAATEELEHQTFGKTIYTWLAGCFWGLILSLIISAIIKRQ